ncbi:lipase 3-like [Tribolium madens]|uniref:lipase 3-like n=1 Tax=Tribolium madens TaxID=41895 RepID=UPI001CF7459B|nr:lipase 3-like [Tribolium madens]
MHRFLLLVLFLPIFLCENVIDSVKCSFENLAACPYNPDADLDTPQIARRHGYPAESHYVTTEDGYILTIHRIPGPKTGERGGQPVFLQHGLLSSSADWIIAGNESLGFMLADAGYDVWMGNARGNTYSKAHLTLPIQSPQYWNFSWHEMGIYDLPAALYYVSNTTNKPGEIIYVGHSMGTTMFFVLASTKPQVAKNVKLMVALAPVAYMTHVKSPIRYLSPFAYDFEWLARYLGLNQFLPNNKIMKFLGYDCELLKIDKEICEDVIFTLCGFDKEEFNEELLPVVLSHDPAGSSTKTVLHYSQEIKYDGKFQQYDYGPDGNKIKYGTLTPPQYKLLNIKVKTYLMYALNDFLASYIDVIRLSQNLTNNVGMYQVPLESFNHVDFLFGKHAAKLVYKPLMKVLQNYSEAVH